MKASVLRGMAAAVAGALVLAGAAAGAVAADPYRINVVLPLTGGASFLGKAEQQTLQLVQKRVNDTGGIGGGIGGDRTLEFVFHDDQSVPQTAVQLTSRILAERPAVVIGSAVSAMCKAMAPLMVNGSVMYCLSPAIHPGPGSSVFTSGVSTHHLGQALIRHFRLQGWTRIAIMTSSDATGQDADKGFEETLKLPENTAVTVVAWPHFTAGDVSVSAQLETIKAARPQALIAWSTGAAIATIFKGIVQAGLDLPVGTTDGNMTLAQMNQYAAFLPRDLYLPAARWAVLGHAGDPAVMAVQRDFVEAFRTAGRAPESPSAYAWDPAMLVVDALRVLGPAATGPQLRDHLARLKDYVGVNGAYDFQRFPQRGLDVENAVVTRWDASRQSWTPVSGPAGRLADLPAGLPGTANRAAAD